MLCDTYFIYLTPDLILYAYHCSDFLRMTCSKLSGCIFGDKAKVNLEKSHLYFMHHLLKLCVYFYSLGKYLFFKGIL